MSSCIVCRPKPKDGKPVPKLKAYKVLEVDEHTGGIVFAAHHAVARRAGANEWGDGEWDYVECSRAPQFDAIGPEGMNDLVLWRDGWWFECHCGARIDDSFPKRSSDMVWDPAEGDFVQRKHPLKRLYCAPARDEPVLHKGSLYCDPWCVLTRKDFMLQRAQEARLALTMARLTGKLEGCTHLSGRAYHETLYDEDEEFIDRYGRPRRRRREVKVYEVTFRFPGSKFNGSWKHTDPTKVYVSKTDIEAWHKFEETRRAASSTG
ncbi:hypothetical protein CcrC1_gp098 [Caulobacter phage C1]|nr:hypothetical protein CcrC1_gp098 [Caulobacter phage C1]UTU08326.1 hypothetical protein CcrC2_gp098 [Caulobacter phage C2]UTU08846.1 hypothetical protein CcrJ4_gp095 [Caulobacter phage J4]UTU09400.1 hypothetical protein CcrBL47_gp114 [Caulobacter phage BL47]UTU09960.1 hypothetical protein CcrRB23_gp098 [Caulobacter phage RB23]WGN96985.1 hypothetical protein [Bertelyvirus sp.]